ncbi:Uncharacterised protein [Amycolatopsis camponoti]|uniref:Tetratricopeptide repeat protein n=1 Tax=Amycolatopsis camponoti TaxID=2606593 RepID=A0A6I8LXG4_9PSEU|nr:Uncharacterised protein [Amycolatopsis camponoti]
MRPETAPKARAVIEAVLTEATAAGQGTVTERCDFSRAVLCNGLGQYEEALVAARAAVDYHPRMYLSAWAAVELLKAAIRAGRTAVAEDALHHVLEATVHLPNDAAQGIVARSRALMTTGERADGLYRDAIERLGRSLLRAMSSIVGARRGARWPRRAQSPALA